MDSRVCKNGFYHWSCKVAGLFLFSVLFSVGCEHSTVSSSLSQGESRNVDSSKLKVSVQDQQKASDEKKKPRKKLTDADFSLHKKKLKEKYRGRGFHVVIEKPFVVIGDESERVVKARAAGTVRWAVTKLKKKYFKEDPDHIIDIWLMKDKNSYGKICMEILKEKPGTPFGFYRADAKVLMMNISTGGGTLVHEIVHPYVGRNFPDCPSWFNEGLASLYEQSNEKNKQIVGLTNWRLSGLQKAIIDKKVPSFKTLCSTTTHQFYNQDPGTNYSQARYLCYYLQEKKLLKKYYDLFSKNVKKDPTGYKSLLTVLGKKDLVEFQKDWEKYVLRLRF